jgi:hypothetical protein
MVRIDVDYNERDSDGYVVARVPEGQLMRLRNEQRVSLYDPVDRLWADATVAWIDSKIGAAGFKVDWTSFVDGDLTESHEPVRILLVVNSGPTARLNLKLTLERPVQLSFIPENPVIAPRRHLPSKFSRLLSSLGRRKSRHHAVSRPLVFDYSIRVAETGDTPSSSSDVAELSTGWELTHS